MSGSPDFCGAEKTRILGMDYWNMTTLESGEHFDKRVNCSEKFQDDIYLTDDQGQYSNLEIIVCLT